MKIDGIFIISFVFSAKNFLSLKSKAGGKGFFLK